MIYNTTFFSKFDMKYGFWKIQIQPEDRYKIAFTVPFGHYEWNVMPFGLKNAHSEFQNMMNDIFNDYKKFSIVYIDMFLYFQIQLRNISNCDAPKPGGPLTTRQPAEYSWMSSNPTPLMKIGQSLLCTGSSTQIQPVPNSLQ